MSALMTYRVGADLLEQMFPVDAGIDPRTLRGHTLKAGAALADRAAIRPPAAAPAITVTVDSTFVRSREDEERRFEVRVGNVETKAGGRQVFGGIAKAGTDIEGLIRKNLDAVGGNRNTVLTAFTDGCPGLRGILAGAGALEPPILDWFHIAMKLQHPKQVADGLTTGDPTRAAAKAVIVTEVERMMTSRPVLVTGATGDTGGYAIDALGKLNVSVRAMVRKDDERAAKLRAPGAGRAF
jgi:hypothetical protein